MESSWLFFNIDELFYRIHIYIVEPIINLFSFRWLFRDSGAARAIEEGSLGVASDASWFDRVFISPLYQLLSSRPSAEHDSVQEYLNPADERGLFQTLWGILFGTGDKESILSLLLGSFVFWIIVCAVLFWLFKKHLYNELKHIKKHRQMLYDMANTGHVAKQASNKAERWQTIIKQIDSEEVTQWKVAVLDADILLDEVLSEQGFAGSTVAEKLASARANPSLDNVEYAGEAHGIRNRIAHQSDYVLTKREAKVAISMYERFFNELYHL